ncbi:MAG TPA: response regulator, partial [Anaeromyxobacteraceae bacterium]|nr:response regulator [Anaeromyxobacteraceae bacterium]
TYMSRILIIEDDAAIREMLSRRLALRGFTVEQAPTGEAGLAMIRASPPDVLLLDHGLPGITGWDVARALRADPATATLPIIALTAHAGEASRKEALAAGCNVFLTKPVDMKALERELLQVAQGTGP